MILLFVGKSASGKDTYVQEMVNKGYKRILGYTCRPIREGEQDGVDYNFVSKEEFLSLIDNNKILEYRTYDTNVNGVKETWYYGSPIVNPSEKYVGIVDVDGANTYIEKYGEDNIIPVYITVSDKIRTQRAMSRGSFDETEWNRRLADDNERVLGHLINSTNTIYIDNENNSIEDNIQYILEQI